MKLLREYLHRISRGAYRMNKSFLLQLLEQNEKAKVLDIGCADGSFSRQVADRIGVEQIYGVEISPRYVYEACKKGVYVVLGDVDRGLPFKDDSFDIVFSNQVLEHVNSTDDFIKECYRVLSNGGICIASTPNLASPHNIISLILGYQPPVTAVSDEVICGNPLDPCDGQQITAYKRHRRIFTASALKKLFEFHGFKVETLSGIGLHPLPTLVSRYIRSARYSLFLVIKARKSPVHH